MVQPMIHAICYSRTNLGLVISTKRTGVLRRREIWECVTHERRGLHFRILTICLSPTIWKPQYTHGNKHPGCGMVFANGAYLGGPYRQRETIIPEAKSRRLARDGVRLVDLFDKIVVRLQASLISKEAYQTVGGHDESLRICMDLDLSFRLFMRYPVAYLDRVVFLYRRHEGNAGRNEELRLTENIRVIEKLVEQFPAAEHDLGRRRIAQRMSYRYYRLAKGCWKRGQRELARKAIRQATSLCPLALKYQFYRLQWGATGR
jgi:hypothetical protein